MSIVLRLTLEEVYQLLLALKQLRESHNSEPAPEWLKKLTARITDQVGGKKLIEKTA